MGELLGDSSNIALVRQALGPKTAPDDVRGSFMQRLGVICVLSGLVLLTILGPLQRQNTQTLARLVDGSIRTA